MFIRKKIKQALCVAASAVMLGVSALTFTSCESSWPKVTLEIGFNGKTYSIAYKLYRKFYPQTVRHFLELTALGYYTNLAFHNYNSTGMFTGSFEYDETEANNLKEKDYFAWAEQQTLTQSVFEAVDDGKVPTKGLNTLIGEFTANSYSIENNDKKYGAEKEGCLVMYYEPNSSASLQQYVTVKRNTKRSKSDIFESNEARYYDQRDYSMNCATSQFYITFNNTTSSVNKNYCVFGELFNDDAEDTYDSLTSAIKTFISNNYGDDDDDFVEEVSYDVYVDDPYLGNGLVDPVTYSVPQEPIVLKRVRINRY
jgi:cyclophilin family peptidyl-prolyl cis-trans isomerase